MYMVDESDGMVDIRVFAFGRTSFAYKFTVTPMDLTATSKFNSDFVHVTVYWNCHLQHAIPLICADNFDYTYPTTQYTFGPTDENEPIPSLVISIPISNDDDNELDENFKLTLEVSADGEAANVTEGRISMIVVLIKDDDSKTKAIEDTTCKMFYHHFSLWPIEEYVYSVI